MAALAVGLLVMPYAKPLACGLADHGAVASYHPRDVEDKSPGGSDDGGVCHDLLTCNLASVAMSPEGREALMLPVCHQQETRPPEFIPANLQPPRTPPPRI